MSATAPQNPERPADKAYRYTFDGWDKEFTSVYEDMVVTAKYRQVKQVYYIRGSFNGWSEENVMEEISDGVYTFEMPLASGEYEYKAANSDYSMSWPYGANAVLTLERAGVATFTLNTHNDTVDVSVVEEGFKVTFLNYDGTVLSTQSVPRGVSATAPETPVRAGDVNFTYEFTGWDKDFSSVNDDMVITAQFKEVPQIYYIRGTFNDWTTADAMTKNDDGTYSFTTTLAAGYYEYKAANNDYSMEWPMGGNKTLELDRESIVTFTLNTTTHTLTVSSVGAPTKYSVVFKDWDGTVLSEQRVEEGHNALAPSDPARSADVNFIYTFAGWDKNYFNVTEDRVITAKYTETAQEYFIRGSFNDFSDEGKMHKSSDGIYTYVVTLPQGTYQYKATNADGSFKWPEDTVHTLVLDTDSKVAFTLDVVSGELKAYPSSQYKKYTVSFVDYDGKVIESQKINQGESAVAPADPQRTADAQYTYIFAYWDGDFENVQTDLIITARYVKVVNKYIVAFIDNEGKLITTQSVSYGESAEAPEAPKKSGYTFIGWDKDFTSVTGNLTVKAQYEKNDAPVTPPEAATTGTLRVEVAGGTGFTISAGSANARPQGTSYMNSKTSIGTTVTVNATTTNGNKFVGWMNDRGLILTTDLSYTFTTTGNDYLKAMYQTDIEEATLVIFKNDKANQILDMQYYVAGDEIVFPEYPQNSAYLATGWTMTAEEIAAKVAAGESVTVVPTWERILVYVNIEVVGGTATGLTDGKALKLSAVTATAAAAPAGQKFAYWVDQNGNVLSYQTTYKFYPAEDMTVTAVYVAESETIDYEIILNFVMDTSAEAVDTNPIILSWEVTESDTVKFVQAGALLVESSKYNADTFEKGTTDTNVTKWTPGTSNQKPVNTVTANKKGVANGSTWYGMGWITVEIDGVQQTIYTDIKEFVK